MCLCITSTVSLLPYSKAKATNLLAVLDLGGALSAGLLLALALLEQGLRDHDLVLGRNRTVGTIRLVRSPRHVPDIQGYGQRGRAPVGELPTERDILSSG